METVIVTGVFALVGAIIGSVLSGLVQRKVREQTARAERIDSAIRSVALALASGNFIWSVGMTGAPPSVTPEDEAESSRAMYLKGIERRMTALHDAKHDLTILTTDGVDTGLPVNILDSNLSTSDLAQAYDALTKLRGTKHRA